MEVVALLSQGRTAAAQCGLFTHKSVSVIFEPPCTYIEYSFHTWINKKIMFILYFNIYFKWGRDNAVGIANRYGLDGPGDRIPVGAKFFAPFQTGLGAYLGSYTMGTESFPGVKRPGRGVDHTPHLAPRLKEV